MNLGSTLNTTFATARPLDGSPLNSSGAPISVVYRNGAVLAPAVPPLVANMFVGSYSLVYPLTLANGHASGDWVTITEQVLLDTAVITRPAWEGNLNQISADACLVLGQTIYPMFTTHQPSTGINQDPDGGAAPVVTIYRNLVVTGIVPVLINPAVGVYIVTLPLTVGAGWAFGDTLDILSTNTIDGITTSNWVFSGGKLVPWVDTPAAEIIRGAVKRGVVA
jgi:hypothetical protein